MKIEKPIVDYRIDQPKEAAPAAEVKVAERLWLETAQAEGRPIPIPRYRPAIYQVAH